jgi:periplasmic divalent cation tolerance protein
MTDVLLVFCTCPDAVVAERLARGLVDERLAACVNILPEIRSIYRWEGKVQNDGEVLMMVKTTRSVYPALENWLGQHHPYDVAEILAVPVHAGSGNYLDWVVNETKSDTLV